MAKRRLAITKKVSLADIADGWDDECYATVAEVTRREYFKFADVDTDKITEKEAIEYQSKFVKEHLLSGKVKVLGDDNALVLTDITPDDIDDSAEITGRLFLAILGADLDPKGTKTPTDASETEAADTSPQSPEDTSATTSSTESPTSPNE